MNPDDIEACLPGCLSDEVSMSTFFDGLSGLFDQID